MKKNGLVILICLFCLNLSGCMSKPKFEGDGDLCGLVIDENNLPVSDFVVSCSALKRPVTTNESGLFVFYSVPSGEYSLSGKKTNYLQLKNVNYNFSDRSKIIVMQTKSFKAAILSAEEDLRLGQLESAKETLDDICYEAGSSEENYIRMFKFYTLQNKREQQKYYSKLKKRINGDEQFFNKYLTKMEEVIK